MTEVAILALQILAAGCMFAGVWLTIGLVHAFVWMGAGWADRGQVLRAVLGWPSMMLAGLWAGRVRRRVVIIVFALAIHAGAMALGIKADNPFVSILLGVMAATATIRLARWGWR